MTAEISPFVWLTDDITVRGKKREIVYILEFPENIKDTIASLIETGLSKAERMPESLEIMEALLRSDGRFTDVAAEMKIYRETVFSRNIPFTMIEARAILSKLRRWQELIERRLEAEGRHT